jgi:hypothetical protein
MKSPSEYIAPFDEDRQTGLVQTAPDGGVVAVGVAVAVAVAVGVGVRVGVAVAVGVTVGVRVGVAVGVGVTVGVAVAVGDTDGLFVGGLVVETDALGLLVGGVVVPSLSTVKSARRTEVPPYDHVSTAVMVCDPSASFVVSKGYAEPSLAVAAKSKGGRFSVRTGDPDLSESSR